MMWKFAPLVLRYPGSRSTDYVTGETVYVGEENHQVRGRIVPASPEDIERGFQIGSHTCFCSLPFKPVVGTHKVIDDNEIYEISRVEYWKEKDLYVLELRK